MVRQNVTVAPSENARAVLDPEIEYVRDKRSGLLFETRRFIEGRRYDRLVKLRGHILEFMKRGMPRLACALCGCPVYLVSSTDKAFFFRHKVEDGSCTAQTRKGLSDRDIKAWKYHGARESEAHLRVKELIVRGLQSDPRVNDVRVEKVWRSLAREAYRRPDVQARFGDIRVAFEAQLTTTFLDVVVGRRMFYRGEGALLVWILRRFDPAYRRLTEDDIFFSNNSNVLVVDDETTRISEATCRFTLRCHFRAPFIAGEQRQERWCCRLVGFDELTLDMEGQRAYWFDFEAEDRKVRDRLAQQVEERRRTAQNRLRNDIFSFWERCGGRDGNDREDADEWSVLRGWLMRSGIDVPHSHRAEDNFRIAISSLLSAKLGRPVGYRYTGLIEVAHLLAEYHKQHLYAFGWALRAYGTDSVVAEQDQSGKWAKRKEVIHSRMVENDPAYWPCKEWSDALRFLFPEIGDRIGRRLQIAELGLR